MLGSSDRGGRGGRRRVGWRGERVSPQQDATLQPKVIRTEPSLIVCISACSSRQKPGFIVFNPVLVVAKGESQHHALLVLVTIPPPRISTTSSA